MTVKRPTRRSLNVSPFPEITDPPPTRDADKRTVLGHLIVARDTGEITPDEFDTFGQMLGVLEGGA